MSEHRRERHARAKSNVVAHEISIQRVLLTHTVAEVVYDCR
ncbi:MAG: hypothetical protein ACR2KJ_17000 [Jatrophihabitans sp.]